MVLQSYIQVLAETIYRIVTIPRIQKVTVTKENWKQERNKFLQTHILRQIYIRFVVV